MDSMVERCAKAIYDATDPLSGDPIATLIHVSDHLFWDGVQPDKEMTDIERQLEAVQEVCRAAARAAINALMEPTPPMREAMDELAGTINPADCWYAAIEAALSDTEGR